MLENSLFKSDYHNRGRSSFKLHEDIYSPKGIEPPIFKPIEQNTFKDDYLKYTPKPIRIDPPIFKPIEQKTFKDDYLKYTPKPIRIEPPIFKPIEQDTLKNDYMKFESKPGRIDPNFKPLEIKSQNDSCFKFDPKPQKFEYKPMLSDRHLYDRFEFPEKGFGQIFKVDIDGNKRSTSYWVDNGLIIDNLGMLMGSIDDINFIIGK